MEVSGKAMTAYQALLSKKKYGLLTASSAGGLRTPSLAAAPATPQRPGTADPSEASVRLVPQPSHHSPTAKQKQQQLQPSSRADNWGNSMVDDGMSHGSKADAPIDALIDEFESGFESIAVAAGSLLNQSRATMNRPATRGGDVASSSFSLIGARQSKVDNVDETSSDISSGLLNDDNMSAILYGSASSQNLASQSTADVEAILEKYSDRLMSMVTEKMIASQKKLGS
jgi:hypothetical protein